MLTEEEIKKFEAQHGGADSIAHCKDKRGRWECVLRPATPPEYKLFRRAYHDIGRRADAAENLFRATCVYPSGAELEAMLTRFPMVSEACTDRMIDLVGGEAESIEK